MIWEGDGVRGEVGGVGHCSQYAQQGEVAKMADVCLFVFACYLRLHWESGGNCSGRQQGLCICLPIDWGDLSAGGREEEEAGPKTCVSAKLWQP